MSTPTVAVLGTGIMGAPMAANLARAGLSVRVWNRTPAKAEPLADVGATVCGSAAEAVEGADVVLTSLFNVDAANQVMAEAAPGLGPDAIWLQTSTVGVQGTKDLAALAGRLGLRYVDAPVLGTKKPAEDGALVMLVGADASLRPELEAVFEAISSKVMWAGDVGTGSALKLVCNAWVLTTVDGIAQSLALARSLDLDPKLFLDAVKGGAVDSPYVQLKGGAMLTGEFTPPSFPTEGGAKDAGLIVDAASAVGLSLPVLSEVRAHFDQVVAAGHDEEDLAAVFRAYQD